MDEPRWLDEVEMTAWRSLVETANRLFERLEAELKADSGLTFADYEVLVHLSEADERRMRMSDLADQVVHSRSRLTARIDRMQERGLVDRHPSEVDRRVTYASLTETGFTALVTALPNHLDSVRTHLFDHLDREDVVALAEVLPKINEPLNR